MAQIGRDLTDVGEGFLRGARYLIHDRAPMFTPVVVRNLAPLTRRA
jgi:hypothetical protein